MQTNIEHAGDRSVLALKGCWDRNTIGCFRSAYRQALAGSGVRRLVIDMTGVEHMNSFALGSLLLLKRDAEASRTAVALAGCRPSVQGLLRTANIDRMFVLARGLDEKDTR